MTRPAAGRHQHDIETRGQRRKIRAMGEEMLQGTGDAQLLPRRERLAGAGEIGARFDLDRGKNAAAAGDEIDLADGRFVALRQDAIAFETQLPETKPLRPAPAALSRGAVS